MHRSRCWRKVSSYIIACTKCYAKPYCIANYGEKNTHSYNDHAWHNTADGPLLGRFISSDWLHVLASIVFLHTLQYTHQHELEQEHTHAHAQWVDLPVRHRWGPWVHTASSRRAWWRLTSISCSYLDLLDVVVAGLNHNWLPPSTTT